MKGRLATGADKPLRCGSEGGEIVVTWPLYRVDLIGSNRPLYDPTGSRVQGLITE